MQIDILTLFPESFASYLDSSILKIAQDKGAVQFRFHNFRDFASGAHRKVDDKPFGGGPGMVLKPEPIFECLEQKGLVDATSGPVLLMSPQGERYNQRTANELSQLKQITIIAGHYEGFDQRIVEGLPVRPISIGDYVLTGGELAALVLVDSVVRLLPGVLGDSESTVDESFNGDGLLDFAHYTRPMEYRGMEVPEVLRSGNHAKIEEWRRQSAFHNTERYRPDLLDSPDDLKK